MRRYILAALTALFALFPDPARAEDGLIPGRPAIGANHLDESVSLEATASQARATAWLLSVQSEAGDWSKHPGITAAALLALHQADPDSNEVKRAIDRGLDYIATKAQPDGAFALASSGDDLYATSLCVMALSELGLARHRTLLDRGRSYLVRHRQPAGPAYGGEGFSYQNSRYPDLSNTQWVVEALYVSQPRGRAADRDTRRVLDAAVAFLSECQVATGDDLGAFAYFPPGLKQKSPHDRELKGERVWGSLTYGALKTLVYGGVGIRDPRLVRGIDWAVRHYTAKTNPGLEDGGYYYYIYMLATTHSVLNVELGQHNWRRGLLEALLSRQKGNGSWVNSNPLWKESDANLCTAYALLGMSLTLAAD